MSQASYAGSESGTLAAEPNTADAPIWESKGKRLRASREVGMAAVLLVALFTASVSVATALAVAVRVFIAVSGL